MKPLYTYILIAIVVVMALLGSTLFTVYESERAIIARLGELRKDSKTGHTLILGPGLHAKLPFVDELHRFDSRLNMTDIPSERILTKDKELLMVDLFVQWRITDYGLFYTSTYGSNEALGNRERAEQLLKQNVKGVLHSEFGQRTLINVVSGERKQLMERLVDRTDENVRGYGMQVVDVRVNRVDYPPEVNDKVFARMISERKQVAVGFRANGESKAAIIRADADRTARVMVAEAEKESERLKGEGDAKALQIYADSYSRSPEFFEFYRSLEAYRKSFQEKQDIFVLKPDSAFFKYFKGNAVVNGNNPKKENP
jgi:membrane protease subunit HflC